MSGATFTPTGTYTNNSGTMTLDVETTTTLGAHFTTVNNIALINAAKLDTSSNNYTLTHAGTFSLTGVSALHYAYFNPRASTINTNGAVSLNGYSGWAGWEYGPVGTTNYTWNINANVTSVSEGFIHFGTGTKNASASVTITAGDNAYLVGIVNGTSTTTTVFTGIGNFKYVADSAQTAADLTINNVYFNSTLSTGAGMSQLTINGNITVYRISSGPPNPILVTAGVTITGIDASTANFSLNGALTMAGTSGSHITVTNTRFVVFNSGIGSSVNLSYVDFVSARTTSSYGFLFYCDNAVVALDNLTFTSSSSSTYGGMRISSGSYIPSFAGCTFNNLYTGTGVNNQDVYVLTGAVLQLSSCTFTTVGLQATSGWLVSKDHAGVANDMRIYGVLNASTPSAPYQIAGTDNVIVKQADAYSTPFNTVLTINQNTSLHTITEQNLAVFIINTGITITWT